MYPIEFKLSINVTCIHLIININCKVFSNFSVLILLLKSIIDAFPSLAKTALIFAFSRMMFCSLNHVFETLHDDSNYRALDVRSGVSDLDPFSKSQEKLQMVMKVIEL